MKLPIQNIFSKETDEPKSAEKTLITVDHREKNSLIPSLLIEKEFKVEYKQLPIADYLIKDTAIERKTIADLKSSIINKRIFQQLNELKQYPAHLLLVEGIIDEDLYAGRIHANALRGFLLSVALEFKTPVIYTYDEKDTARYLSVLAKKQPKTDLPIRASKIYMTKKEQQQFILEGFPNLGPVKAKALLENFNSLNDIFNASEAELTKILGIQAKDFKDLLE